MFNALEISLDIDLASFSRFLHGRGLQHRITQEGMNQVVWVGSEPEAAFVQAAFEKFQAGELDLEPVQAIPQFRPVASFREAVARYPMTLILILVNLACFPLGMSVDGTDQLGELFSKLMFLKLVDVNGDLYFTTLAHTLASGEYWRLITPMLIHFSWLHVVFNLLWVWEIGRRIEARNGAVLFLLVVLLTSVASNMTQYLMAGPGLFGGMSGVVFGLLGHSLVWSRLVPLRSMDVPTGIYIFMLVYLVIGFTGAIDLLGLGSLANGAHLGGLLGGVATGAIAGLLVRFRMLPRS